MTRPFLSLLLGLALTQVPAGVFVANASENSDACVRITGVRDQVGEPGAPRTRFHIEVIVGGGALVAGESTVLAFPGIRRGRFVTVAGTRRLPRVGETVMVRLSDDGRLLSWTFETAEKKALTVLGAPVVAVTDGGIPLRWPVRGIYLSPSDGCPTEALDALDVSVSRWLAGSGHSLEFLLDDPGLLEPGYVTDGLNYNVITCVFADWPYSSMADGMTILTYIDEPDGNDDGLIIDADILLNFESGGFTSDSTQLYETILGHELGHLIGMEHPCNAPDDFIDKNLAGCTGIDLPESAATSIMYPYSTSGNSVPNEADLSGVALLFPEGDDRPVERVRIGEEGCGCSTPGRSGAPLPLGLLVLLVLAVSVFRARQAACRDS